MQPRNLGPVVDGDMRVYSTCNLRVVDVGIYPMIPGAHLRAVADEVAERAADLIKADQ